MNRKILIVDDSLVVRRLVVRALTGAGYEVIEARDGQEALEKLAESKGVSLVVCDVNMPRMDGMQFLERVREGSPPGAVPVVMLTTEGQTELVRRAKSLGAKGWITKPFKAEHLVAAARKLAPTRSVGA